MHQLLIFNDKQLLRRALTHRSYVNENPRERGDNERLEFLGDAILNFISGDYLYSELEMDEGEMTRRRAALVDKEQLAKFAIQVGLPSKMRLGQGVIQQGGRRNKNLLSSTFEAVVGAYYLDHDRDIETLRPLVEELFDSVLLDIIEVGSNSKNLLQEFVHAHIANAKELLRYSTKQTGGTDNKPEFTSRVSVNNKFLGEGRGKTKKEAEKQAAENALAKLKKRYSSAP
ncbi:MAG: ribonuclease III [Prochloron sp. SP5CPC1]|nr:ribonuclease III [Candidatus Paraprochloron terpiosi SP5CPC1]